MSGFLDGAEIPITCPKCGYESRHTIGWIKENSDYTCICGQVIHLDADQFRDGIEEVDRAFGDLKRDLGNL